MIEMQYPDYQVGTWKIPHDKQTVYIMGVLVTDEPYDYCVQVGCQPIVPPAPIACHLDSRQHMAKADAVQTGAITNRILRKCATRVSKHVLNKAME